MGIISKIGRWIDHRFPERIPVEEVYKSLAAYSQLSLEMQMLKQMLTQCQQRLDAFERGARAFDNDLALMKDEMNKAKTVLAMMNKMRTTPVLNSSEAWKR